MSNVTFGNLTNHSHAVAGEFKLDENSGGLKLAIDFLENNGPVSKNQVNTFRDVFSEKVDQNMRGTESRDDLEILSLLTELMASNFEAITAQDGQAGLSASDLRGAADSSQGTYVYEKGSSTEVISALF